MAVDAANIEYALSLLKARQASDRKYIRYYGGFFDLAFASNSFHQAFGSWLRKIGYNRCRSVVDAFADRTTVTGWDLPDGADALQQQAEDVWSRNNMSNRQNEIVKEAYRTGDGYVHVWPDEDTGLARLYMNPAYCMVVVYDDEYPDHVDFAVKCWQIGRGPDKGKWRLTTYDPSQIVRLITSTRSDNYPEKYNRFTAYNDDGQPEVENPLGEVPIVHFGNDADTGGYGTSELSDVLPLQDGANKALADMLVASEFVAYPQRYAIGVDEPERDPVTGKEENPFIPGMNRLWTISGSQDGDQPVSFGQFTPADMTQFIDVQDSWDMKIARVSRVPVHWLNQSGDFPSGESLKTAEAQYVSKVIDRQGSFTSPHSRVMQYALRFEGAGEDEVAPIKPIWMPAESRSEREKWEIAQFKKAANVPVQTIWAENGYTSDQIIEMQKLVDAEADKAQQRFAQSFDRGEQTDNDQRETA